MMNNKPKQSLRTTMCLVSLALTPVIILITSIFPGTNSKTLEPVTTYASWRLNDKTINLEVAKTDAQQRKGLKERKNIPKDQGMLFKLGYYIRPNTSTFNMQVPIDVILVSKGKVTAVQEGMMPCNQSEEKCSIKSEAFATDVIEVATGFVKEHNIKIGQILTITEK